MKFFSRYKFACLFSIQVLKNVCLLFIFIILFESTAAAASIPSKKFSIVIPIYNTERYLPECLDCAINQTYKNIEIILVNDSSPGNADEICKKYVKLDSRIKYIKQKNQGVSIARNNGIEAASGDYIFCLDSDDTMELQFIEKINEVFEKTSCDCVIIGEKFCRKSFDLIGAVPTWAIAVSTKFLKKYPDVRFPAHFHPGEDGLFSHKVTSLTDKIAYCKSAIYYYRENPTSCEHTLNNKKLLSDISKWFEILEKFYAQHNLWNTKKVHLLAFIWNEPFERLFHLPFSYSEKTYLFQLTQDFMKKHKLNDSELIKPFPLKFRWFVKSDFYITSAIKQKIVQIMAFFYYIYSLKDIFKFRKL